MIDQFSMQIQESLMMKLQVHLIPTYVFIAFAVMILCQSVHYAASHWQVTSLHFHIRASVQLFNYKVICLGQADLNKVLVVVAMAVVHSLLHH